MIAILHNLRSIYNTASCFRTADGAGIKKIYLTGSSPTPIDRFGRKVERFIKVSLGAENTVKWQRENNIIELIMKLKKKGFLIVAVEQSSKSIRYDTLKLTEKKLCLVFGNEVDGLSEDVLEHCDRIIEIPMRGKKESLNVSVAFGVAVYHLQN